MRDEHSSFSLNPWINPSPWRIWTLIGGGIVLFLFADSIGSAFAKSPQGHINPTEAASNTLKIYLLGGTSILVGLVERIVSVLEKR